MNRKTKQRLLNSAGIYHVAGWVKKSRIEDFVKLIEEARGDVIKSLDGGGVPVCEDD